VKLPGVYVYKAAQVALGVAAVALAFGCPDKPLPPPPGGEDCGAYCANLARFGCLEGKDPMCPKVCDELRTQQEHPFDFPCGLRAPSKDVLQRTCHVRCPTE
jgi:hypothetical protein